VCTCRYMITIAVAFLIFAGTMLHLQVPTLLRVVDECAPHDRFEYVRTDAACCCCYSSQVNSITATLQLLLGADVIVSTTTPATALAQVSYDSYLRRCRCCTCAWRGRVPRVHVYLDVAAACMSCAYVYAACLNRQYKTLRSSSTRGLT
jgi:hypothetical protein